MDWSFGDLKFRNYMDSLWKIVIKEQIDLIREDDMEEPHNKDFDLEEFLLDYKNWEGSPEFFDQGEEEYYMGEEEDRETNFLPDDFVFDDIFVVDVFFVFFFGFFL